MKEDVNLGNRCLIIWIASLAASVAIIVLELCLVANDQFHQWASIVLGFALSLLTGVFGGAFVLWINKKFDYLAKKEDLLIDYFFVAFNLRNIISNAKPVFKNHNNVASFAFYETFNENKGLWNELQHIHKKISFSRGDEEIKALVSRINDSIKKQMDDLNSISQLTGMLDDPSSYISIKEHERELFDASVYKANAVYTLKKENDLLPDLQKLETHLFGESSLEDKACPNFWIPLDKLTPEDLKAFNKD